MLSVLMIMNSFAPNNTCGAIPNTKLAKYLAREDVKITLVTDAITEEMNLDMNLVPDTMDRMRVIHVWQSDLYHSTLGKMRAKMTDSGVKLKMKSETRPLRAHAVSVIKNTFFRLRQDDWLHSAGKTVWKELEGEHFDVVYSTYPKAQAHYLAQALMRKGVADKWIVDFRDPMCYLEYDKYRYERSMRQQHRFERAADHVTVVSEGAMDKFLPENKVSGKMTYLPNGFDPDDFADVAKTMGTGTDGRLRLFYAGTLYSGKRDLTVLFRAISELIAEGLMQQEKIRVEYAGNEWPIMESYAAKYCLESICTNYGFITRQRVMELMGEIDCSIVCTHNTAADHGVVTGKVFELLLAAKPIVAVITGDLPDSELGSIVKECRAGVVYEEANGESDYLQLKQWLKDAYTQKQSCGMLVSALDEAARDRYNYRSLARQLYEIMTGLTENRAEI